MKSNYLTYLLMLLIFIILYFGTAKLGLSLEPTGKFVSLVWFPSGLALASLLLFGFRFWPGIMIGAFLINFFNGDSPIIAFGIAMGITLEAVIGVYLLKFFKFHVSLSHLSDVLLLVVVGSFIAGMSATIGVSTLYFGGIITFLTYYPAWLAWWMGDIISILIIAPFFLIWSSLTFKSIRFIQIFEAILLALFVIIVGEVLFQNTVPFESFPITYLVFLPLIWSCLRFGQRGGVTVVFVLSLFALLHTFQGGGSFVSRSLSERLFFLQCFIGVIAVTSLILSAVDTERKELEDRKDEFIGLASHELRTPLTSVKAYSQLLEKLFIKQNDRQAASYANKMDRQIDRLSLLVSDLLDISKIQAGKLELHKEYFSLFDLIVETVEVVQETISTHEILVKKLVNKSIGKIYADKGRIAQVIINLLTNAVKYSPEADKVIVKIVFEGERSIVSIRDFGIGIPQNQQKKIFDRYYRIGGGYGKSSSGLGIGLYISHEIIKRSGGKLWIENEKGKGCTFYFSLPAYS